MYSLLCYSIVLLLSLTSAVHAQTGSQNASIPDCVRGCDTAAIARSNCTSMDQFCHCQQKTVILDSIVPCVVGGEGIVGSCGDNGVADVEIFEQLFNEVCAQFNITVPTTVTAVGTPGPTWVGTATPSAYTGGAGMERTGVRAGETIVLVLGLCLLL